MGNLVKLVPSLANNTPSLDSLLPMLSELASSRTKSRTTPATTSCQTTSDELITLPVLVPKLQAAPAILSTSATVCSTCQRTKQQEPEVKIHI